MGSILVLAGCAIAPGDSSRARRVAADAATVAWAVAEVIRAELPECDERPELSGAPVWQEPAGAFRIEVSRSPGAPARVATNARVEPAVPRLDGGEVTLVAARCVPEPVPTGPGAGGASLRIRVAPAGASACDVTVAAFGALDWGPVAAHVERVLTVLDAGSSGPQAPACCVRHLPLAAPHHARRAAAALRAGQLARARAELRRWLHAAPTTTARAALAALDDRQARSGDARDRRLLVAAESPTTPAAYALMQTPERLTPRRPDAAGIAAEARRRLAANDPSSARHWLNAGAVGPSASAQIRAELHDRRGDHRLALTELVAALARQGYPPAATLHAAEYAGDRGEPRVALRLAARAWDGLAPADRERARALVTRSSAAIGPEQAARTLAFCANPGLLRPVLGRWREVDEDGLGVGLLRLVHGSGNVRGQAAPGLDDPYGLRNAPGTAPPR